jgi:predicted CXXCH cytochrome family protein
VDEKIVYRDGPNFTTPPTNAASFLGYSDRVEKKTVCGSCHVGQQGKWSLTAHADAFATLQGSGHMQGSCQGCHTVNNLGNAVTDTTAGWRSTHDERYHDVQCESCHGPGLNHVTTPQRGQMLASILADTGRATTNGCSECHAGTHHPFVEEWRKSGHGAQSNPTVPSPTNARADCQGCHNALGVLASWGVNTNFTEKQSTTYTRAGVTCVVCHDPHGSGFDKQLRFAIDVRDTEQNLCMKCHQRRAVPDPASTSGPHSEQGPLLLGSAGWWPPNLNLGDSIASSHGSVRNPKLCASCHVQRFTVNDKATGAFSFQVTGHRFLAIPCVDANGAPTDVQTCAVTARSFRSCAVGGCHGSEAVARTAFNTVEQRIHAINTELRRLIALVPASQLAVGPVYTTARGAKFNADLADQAGAFVHNPFLIEQLLRASISQMAKDYNLTPSPGYRLAPQFMKKTDD